jgi:hypothetical protein
MHKFTSNIPAIFNDLNGNLEVSETTTMADLSVSGAVDIDTHTYFNTIVIRRPTVFSVDAIFFKG